MQGISIVKNSMKIVLFIILVLVFVQGVQAAATCDNPLHLTFAESRSSYAQHPEVQGTNVVFSENGDIYLLDLTGLTLKEITADRGNSQPVISGNRVAWVHNNSVGTLTTRNNSNQIMIYDLKTGRTRQITNGTAARSQPAFSEDILVWTDSRNGNLDIYAYDFTRENETQISKNSADQDSPAIYGKKVVWRDGRDSGHPQIYVYDLVTQEFTQVSGADAIDPRDPKIYGNRIIWIDKRNGESIYAYDLLKKTESALSAVTSSHVLSASIYKNQVVWHDLSAWMPDRPAMICPQGQFCPIETQGTKYQGIDLHDLADETDTAMYTLWKLSLSDFRPRLSDDLLVWQEDGSIAICPRGTQKIDSTKITRIPNPSQANQIVAQPALAWKTKTGSNENVAAISRDGKFVATGDISLCDTQNTSRVHLYSTSGDPLWEYPVGPMIYSVALSSNGEYLAAGGYKNSLYLFNRNGALLWKFGESDHILNNTVFAVAISEDGSTIAANCADGYQYIFSKDGSVLSKNKPEKYGNGIALTGDGAFIASGSGDKVLLTMVNGTRVWTSAVTGGNSIEDVVISHDGSRIAAGNRDGTVVLLDRTGKILWQFVAGEGNIGVAISDDGNFIAVRGGNRDLYFLNGDGAVIWKYDPKAIAFGTEISLSGDGTLLVAPSTDGTIYLFKTDGTGPAAAPSTDGTIYLFRTDGTSPAAAPALPESVTPTQKSPISCASAGVALVIMTGLICARRIRRY